MSHGKQTTDKIFLNYINENKDCPEKIFNMAKTPWQKQVAVEFFNNEKFHTASETRLANLEKITFSILGVSVLSVVLYLVNNIFHLFG